MLLALLLGSVGYYLALSNPIPDFSREESYAVEVEDEQLEKVTDAGPVQLSYRAGPSRMLEFSFRQSDSSGAANVLTRIDVGLEEKRRKFDEKPGVELERTYQKVGVTIREGDKSVGPRITAQIESLLIGSREVARFDANGKPMGFDWESVTNPQVRQTLSIMRNTTLLVMPRLRRGAVNPGDEWKYRMGADILEDDRVDSIDGDVNVLERYVGVVERDNRRLAVIDRTLDISGSGEIRLVDEDAPRAFDVAGQGSGRVLFDVDAGEIVRSTLTFDRELTIEGASDQNRTRKGHFDLLLREKKPDR